MSSEGSAQEGQNHSKNEIHQLRQYVQLPLELQHVSMMHAMRDTMAEFMRNKGRYESSSAGSSAAVRDSPQG